jgi:hypothetical protein
MSSYIWTLLDPAGNEMRSTDPFASQEDAEAWMGAEWASLLDEGAEFVSLRSGDKQIYKMGLREG